jgi:glycerophosphoryl diester phosphodiesterase
MLGHSYIAELFLQKFWAGHGPVWPSRSSASGSNGELPEETAVAYMRAIDEGTDFIEADVAATKDGHLVYFHDMTLDDTTDVADHKEFAARRRTQEVQWANVTGLFISTYPSADLFFILTVSPICSEDQFIICNKLLLVSRS